ncbi:phosphopantothenoylcysteine decarboxylase/phosphopantothenate--cysteine ligase [gut metagenome]|uniref:Phosphopantothenoylcysteine decarboxylase/phosphopantothenate--cysteine ligase n=1 Tax=gut metagenome TaxID=749906 RepID=J9C4W5_9ZZZZ
MKTAVLKGKKIVLGITGSIAAYKACLLIRGLVKKGAEVQVVITPAGKEFITPLTLSTLTHKPVISEFFDRRDGSWHSHVDLGLWADVMLIAPASASTIGKMAHGIADNMLITTYLSAKSPVFVAPAMDLDMYAHPSTQHNLDILRSYGNHIIEPATGELASQLTGKGRMEEPDEIIRQLEVFFAGQDGDLLHKKILITAGPTFEKIDPVRFIGNYSSGKMGFALADECAARGADVTLVTGPVQLQTHYPVNRRNVESAAQMLEEVETAFAETDAIILSAAVADYTPSVVVEEKIKREKTGSMTLDLKPTQDIAAKIGQMNLAQACPKILVGFALETHNELANAQGKLERKNLDFIVLNSLNDPGAGFRCDTNKISIIDRSGKQDFPLKSKAEVAADIVDHLVEVMKGK